MHLPEGAKPRLSGVQALLQYFTFDHLPPEQQRVSSLFSILANQVATAGTAGPETTTALRKLLEAKDCAVRASLHEKVAVQEQAQS